MVMETRIVIQWDGPTDSLVRHRLSIGMWHAALGKLLQAVRRTASSIITKNESTSTTGRYADESALIDVEIEQIKDGCTRLEAVVTTSEPGLFGALPAQATERFVRDLERAAGGSFESPAVNAYLRSVPAIVTKQEYTVWYDGRVVAQTKIGQRPEEELPVNLPTTYRSKAMVTAISFEPLWVTLRFPVEKIRAAATREQVDYAVAHHETELVASIVTVDGKSRLVGLGRSEAPRLSPDESLERIATDWRETLARLAQ